MRQRDAGNRDAERARIAAKGNRYFIQPTFNVRFWHFSDIAGCPTYVRNALRSGHQPPTVALASLTTPH
jgi:hypothetical protein